MNETTEPSSGLNKQEYRKFFHILL